MRDPSGSDNRSFPLSPIFPIVPRTHHYTVNSCFSRRIPHASPLLLPFGSSIIPVWYNYGMSGYGIDRLGIRERPEGVPAMFQSWLKLLFMHWAMPAERLRPHVPEQLEIDTFDGRAWLGITPFALRNLRPVFAPPLPWLSNFHEMNLRTYVHYRGVPGIWFFSLDADSILAVLGARLTYHLPYRRAHIRMSEEQGWIFYSSRRRSPPSAEFTALWRPGALLGKAVPETLEYFLVERYCLYSTYRNRLYRARIHHEPWILQQAELKDFRSTLQEAHGWMKPTEAPLLHYAEEQHTAVWPLHEVSG